ncbi:MAG: ADP-ribose pyrophosphatase [Acidobacteria bacterium]|nr:ADP-ribose pyrophosphatase [Acidobacteriota bacterium]
MNADRAAARAAGVSLPVRRTPAGPVLTVDALIADPAHGVVLIRRGGPPFAGRWALPGGFVEHGETCEAACVREAREETGLSVEPVALVGVYSDPARDPRFHTCSVVYQCRVAGGRLRGGDDAAAARWFADLTGVVLAFDHARILADAGFLPADP